MPTNPEQTLRAELKVPVGAARVIILSMDAHMDWDWLLNFQNLVLDGNTSPLQDSSNKIIETAFKYMADSKAANAADDYSNSYYYSICEMAFLRAAIETNPGLLVNFKEKIGDKLRIVGGGITSPDNVLPHGELFIRNYLLGKLWMTATLGLPMRQAYIPDDFGHYAQLPVVLDAMGFEGVSFSRCPGSKWQTNHVYPCSENPSGSCNVYKDLTQPGHVDFTWQATDGSAVIAHFMQDHYSQGNAIGQSGDPVGDIQGYIDTNSTAAPTPYLYVPCGDDFATPIPQLVTYANDWNAAQVFGTQEDPNGVYAVAATLDHYIQLIAAYAANQPGKVILEKRPLHPSPYWTGFYASRPELKILSQSATRSLLGAETFACIADRLQLSSYLTWNPVAKARQSMIDAGWEVAVESTHHDFVTGTAVDGVYTGEQIPLLNNACCLGEGARKSAQLEISHLVLGSAQPGETPVVVFNQLGAGQSGLTSLPPMPGVNPKSVRLEDGTTGPVQVGENGRLLFMATVPSLGYQAAALSSKSSTPVSALRCTVNSDQSVFILENDYLKATISATANWGISSLVDKQSQAELIPASATGNDLVFYTEQPGDGNIYTFANEGRPSGMKIDEQGKLVPVSAVLTEDGPLRITVRTVCNFTSGSGREAMTASYIRDYSLTLNEPQLSLSVTGTVPLTAKGYPDTENPYTGSLYSVMVRFPFAGAGSASQVLLDSMPHGNPFHYEETMPEPYWAAPIFQPTHNFVLPRWGGKNMAALFHADIPAWAIDEKGALLGCVLRNTPGAGGSPWGANGSDTGMHTHVYAIRVPSGIGGLGHIGLLREALCFQTPLQAVYGNVPNGPMGNNKTAGELGFPATFSLAGVSGEAIITAAKRGSVDTGGIVLRIYQPTNQPLSVTISLDAATTGTTSTIQQITALEYLIDGKDPQPIGSNGQVVMVLEKALTTFVVRKG